MTIEQFKAMTDAKHTPGPWYRYGYSIRAEDGLPVAMAASCSLADTIPDEDWRVFNEESQRSNHEAYANAALIARAPEMAKEIATLRDKLEALVEAGEKAVKQMEYDDWTNGFSTVPSPALCELRAALTAAKED